MFLKQTRGRKEEKGSSQNVSRGSGLFLFFAAVFKLPLKFLLLVRLGLQQEQGAFRRCRAVKDWLAWQQMQKKINWKFRRTGSPSEKGRTGLEAGLSGAAAAPPALL